jgi:hypothetical protein
MRINEVLRKENKGKRYQYEDFIFEVQLNYSEMPILREVENLKLIEELYNLVELLHVEFREVVDWAKVPVDTKILVKDLEDCCVYVKRYFAEFKDGYIYTWADGKTSFTTQAKTKWNYGKLYEEQLCDVRIEFE